MDLDIGDIIYIENTGDYKKIVGIRSWEEAYNDTVGALATISNRRIQNLDSGDTEIFLVESVEMLRDVNMTLQFRKDQMQGAQGTGTITIQRNGLGNPLMLNRWAYDEPWYAAVTENLGLTLTLQDLALFKGIALRIETVQSTEDKAKIDAKNYTPVPG